MVGTRKTGKNRKKGLESHLQLEFENDFSTKVLLSKTNAMQKNPIRQNEGQNCGLLRGFWCFSAENGL